MNQLYKKLIGKFPLLPVKENAIREFLFKD